ncbi:MAG: ZIP family metal transporter [Gammaproteobacteria bacterium]
MDHTLLLILGFSLLGSVLSVLAAGVYLLLPGRVRDRSLEHLIGFAIGMLLGAGFLHLLPQALEQAADSMRGLMGTALFAILVFFALEKGLIWRHHHHHHHHPGPVGHEHEVAGAPAGALILIGDSVHNFLDGVLIAAAFMADESLGVVTALAVIAHEIPQELGDFAILLHAGFSRARAFLFNLVTSLAMFAGALLAWFLLARLEHVIPYLLTFTAASFIYVAVSDLMPALNRKVGLRVTLVQVLLIGSGLALNVLMHAHD